MLQFFRNFFKSKVGIVITMAFLALIAFAFASMDVANTGTFGGVAGGDRVAVVGDTRVDAAELAMNASSALDRARQQNPTLTMEAFVAQGGLDGVLDQMLSRLAIAELGREYGLRAGDRLIDSEIVQNAEFRGFDGSFDTEAFRAALRQRGLTEEAVRQDLAHGLYARQFIAPVALNPRLPRSVARRYAQLLRERREGQVLTIPAGAFAPEGGPSGEQLQDFYAANRGDFIRPERRVIRYASFDESALANLPAPTPAQIEARYRRDQAQYAASETRGFTQLVVPTQAAAQAIANEVRGGVPLDRAAREKGLATTAIAPATRSALAEQTSAAVAQAGFAAARGQVSAPAQGELGWYLLRVDTVERRAARTLAQVRGEIAEVLAEEQRREALNEATARIEDEFTDGRNLVEVARELGLEIRTTRPLTAAGRIYGTADSAPEVLQRVIPVAFDMDESSPQLAEVVPGQTFLIFDVTDITPSAAAPLAEIRDEVTALWRVDTALRRAGEAAKRILARLDGGSTLTQAIGAEDVALPAPREVSLSRQDVAQQEELPPAMALFFSMAEGTAKRLESREDGVWFVIQVEDITAPEIAGNDPLIRATVDQLQGAMGEEYIEQFVAAAQKEYDIERNRPAIEAVGRQLTGQAN